MQPVGLQTESEVQILAAVRELIGISTPFDEVVESALRFIAATMRADASSVIIVDSQEGHRKFSLAPGNKAQQIEESNLRLAEGIAGFVAEQRSPLLVADIAHEPRFSRQVDQIGGIKTGAFACVPLLVRDEVIGVLAVAQKKVGALTEKDLSLLVAVGGHVAITLENARFVDEVKNLHDKLEQASRLKAQFLATTSHELRTPINIIIGNLDILLGGFLGELTPRQKDSLRTALRNSGEALNLITSLLDLSRVEAGQFVIRVEEFRLDEIWKELELLFRIGLSGKEVELSWETKGQLPLLKTDKTKVKEILSNIIFNAVKYTHQGTIEVTASPLGTGESVQIDIRDTGVGIATDSLPSIFEPFRQVGDSSPGIHAGVGLGLTIARRLLDLLHGQIEVESEVDKGSTFRITLPTKYSA